MLNRQWLLARRPEGPLHMDDFAYREVEFASPELAPGEVLLKSRLFGFAPAMRTWMKGTSQFVPPMVLGEPVLGSGVAEVVASADPAYAPGEVVMAMTGWQDYAVVRPSDLPVPMRRKRPGWSLLDFEGLYGGNSVTAYFGLLRVGQPRAGETLVVSAAAGSTGSMAAQIGKIAGCRVIGIAGGPDKCAWLRDACGLDEAVDYKSEDVEARLKALCPRGVDVFFDNVGGAVLDAVIEGMAPHGRIVLCGQIGRYDDGDALASGPRNMMRVIYWRLKLQGFLAFDFFDGLVEAEDALERWAGEGRLSCRLDLRRGFAELPATFLRLFDGSHMGKLVLEPD